MICGVATYRRLVKDTTSSDADVTTALDEAQQLFEEMTSRNFEQAQRTEVMRLYYNGRVYPKAFPISDVANSPGAVIDGASIILGYGFQYATGVNPFVSGFGADTTNYQPQVTMTYTGGYTDATMPMEVKRAVAQMAYNALNPVTLVGVPVGANNVRVGDLSVSGKDLSGMDVLTPRIRKTIRRFRRPEAEPF